MACEFDFGKSEICESKCFAKLPIVDVTDESASRLADVLFKFDRVRISVTHVSRLNSKS